MNFISCWPLKATCPEIEAPNFYSFLALLNFMCLACCEFNLYSKGICLNADILHLNVEVVGEFRSLKQKELGYGKIKGGKRKN